MKLRPRDRMLLVVVAAFAALAGFYVLVLTPQHREAQSLQQSIASEQGKLRTAQQDYADGRAAQRQLQATTVDYAAAQRAVPQSSNIPALLRLLQHTAAAADVSVNNIALGGSASSTSATSSTSSSSASTMASSGQDTAQTVPVSLTFGGGYQALNRMVHSLDALVAVSRSHLRAHGPLVGISTVSLSRGTGQSLTVVLSATIYQHADASTVLGSSSEGSS